MQSPPHRSPKHLRQHPRGNNHVPLRPQPAAATKPTKAYNLRHPERTLLYRTVAEHFETWLELASAGQCRPVRRPRRPPHPARLCREGFWLRRNFVFANIWSAAPLPTALPASAVTTVVTTSWSPSPARVVESAPRATRGAWPRPQRTCATMYFPVCQCASGCCSSAQTPALLPAA